MMSGQLILFDPQDTRSAAPSPCISVCQMDERSGLCEGCQRDITEIVAWGSASESARRTIWRAINERRDALFDD
jgi:predicted Fe-S protein YdhL (DUF1289 family)